MKITPAQRAALAEINEAGPDGLQFYTFTSAMRRKLVEWGLVEGNGGRAFNFVRWRLTDAGRKALESGVR